MSSAAHEEETSVGFALDILGQNLAVSVISNVLRLIFRPFQMFIRLFS